MTVLAGDFNFVTKDSDRFCKTTGEWTGARDDWEQDDWLLTVATPWSLNELEQEQATHDCATTRSRIDRVYTNHHVSEQLYSRFTCTPLDWCQQLSDHRCLSSGKKTCGENRPTTTRITPSIAQNPEFPLGVTLRLTELEKKMRVNAWTR